ncbi:hypothetical protein EV127DRAFT_49384 [Xylaria flabelliformis]|nr:hypothetical protein EV127DRAFT_49384 [Xylaria flabelliformis]
MGKDIFGKGSASPPLDHPSQVVKNAPSFEDGESYLDSFGSPPPPSLIPTPQSEKRFGCSQCSFSFTEKKDLNRHKNGVHSANKEPPCSCRCGIKRVRKDNHWRLLVSYYTCRCGLVCTEEDHAAHVRSCRYDFGLVGRPRRQEKSCSRATRSCAPFSNENKSGIFRLGSETAPKCARDLMENACAQGTVSRGPSLLFYR